MGFEKNTNRGSWEVGVSNYWGNILFQRCLKSDAFREKLDQVIEELRRYLSEERLEEMVEQYAGVVQPYVEKMPDQLNEPLTPEEYEQVKAGLPKEVEQNYEMYRESLEKPMPFYIGRPVTENGKLKINWDASYDFDAEDITYSGNCPGLSVYPGDLQGRTDVDPGDIGRYSGPWAIFCAYTGHK